MPDLIHEFIAHHADRNPDATALLYKAQAFDYGALHAQVDAAARGLLELGIGPGERVAVYLPKQPETVFGIFGAAAAGAVFVPVNPLLKPHQVAYILGHCNVRVLLTSPQRLALLREVLCHCPDLHTVVVTGDDDPQGELPGAERVLNYRDFCAAATPRPAHRRIDADVAAILYTSGSTGQPKGVVLSHRNLVAGATSVASYLENSERDRILAVLPLSFDAGLSQLTTAFSVGAGAVLMDYLLPRDVIRAVVRYRITGLAAVPPLWNQLAPLEWPAAAAASLRYITNTGGAMPVATTRALRAALPHTAIFLMYGLTEAFRSTYLPPDQVDIRPESMGKAIPNAQIMVVDAQGRECAPGEPGELVHRGALVALGYWNDPEKTAERFRPSPAHPAQLPITELAVWSGDQVVRDEEGYLYFVNRQDDMIKTSGYRVSPTEVEEIVYATGLVAGAAVLGLPHPTLGQAIALLATGNQERGDRALPLDEALLAQCRRELPNFMVPLSVIIRDALPHNPNGKIDRRALFEEYRHLFQDDTA